MCILLHRELVNFISFLIHVILKLITGFDPVEKWSLFNSSQLIIHLNVSFIIVSLKILSNYLLMSIDNLIKIVYKFNKLKSRNSIIFFFIIIIILLLYFLNKNKNCCFSSAGENISWLWKKKIWGFI